MRYFTTLPISATLYLASESLAATSEGNRDHLHTFPWHGETKPYPLKFRDLYDLQSPLHPRGLTRTRHSAKHGAVLPHSTPSKPQRTDSSPSAPPSHQTPRQRAMPIRLGVTGGGVRKSISSVRVEIPKIITMPTSSDTSSDSLPPPPKRTASTQKQSSTVAQAKPERVDTADSADLGRSAISMSPSRTNSGIVDCEISKASATDTWRCYGHAGESDGQVDDRGGWGWLLNEFSSTMARPFVPLLRGSS
ncbi:MAG: hypothetical protein GOMPHAMPRED_002964 [Gomphillus americanus]|uniref:Uncharacterized protein n=1 Tax=Gomphillus americanus TaxID=1940652 RepID=A0A8H3EFT4_9LECA|nr:MAG: hypothetical protein GOMPHAMPRED_002964 [Gomphillus americanus]